jgi:hypothetical protein
VKVGVQIHPQNCSMAELRAGWQAVDALHVHSLWTWDHFFPPLYGRPDEPHFEGWQILAAMAVTTSNVAQIGMLVTGCGYRTPTYWPTWPAPSTICRAGGRSSVSARVGWTRTRPSTATRCALPVSGSMALPRRCRGSSVGSNS